MASTSRRTIDSKTATTKVDLTCLGILQRSQGPAATVNLTMGLSRSLPSDPSLGKSVALRTMNGCSFPCSWMSLFFYLCAESIKFAPLKSQGLDTRTRYIQEETDRHPHVPPPCSPKAIHSLAVAVSVCRIRHILLGFPCCSLPND